MPDVIDSVTDVRHLTSIICHRLLQKLRKQVNIILHLINAFKRKKFVKI
jgi:hypothetical protein